MSSSVDKRNDGSLALFINGDLQFDSNDERIYHEALSLPALAIAQTRKVQQLKALIVGGGDGLVARELFKSQAIGRIDLVDYDQQIVDLARQEFHSINEKSMEDPRLSVHIADAWTFVGDAAAVASEFDLIVSDLTVAEDIAGAQFHSIEWYQMLKHLLGATGVLAVNGVSPHATPEAFWSIFNSMLRSGLHPRPYHVSIPSFRAQGYGVDWGFFLAGSDQIQADEMDRAVLAEPRMTLIDVPHVRSLFVLPAELFNFQPEAAPAHAGSEILLHYFRNSSALRTKSGLNTDSFSLDTSKLQVPEADTGKNIFPPELRAALSECIYASGEQPAADGSSNLVDKVLELMPSLQQFHTPEIIADFVENPAAFLQSIDIAGLVERLLNRAAELPSQLVDELRLLNEKLVEWAGDYLSLVKLGERVVTILTLVVVVGNLMYPDAVYGKGEHGGHAGGEHAGTNRGAHAGSRDGRGFDHADRGFDGARHGAYGHYGRGYGGYRGYWGHNWGAWGWARPYHGFYWGGYVPPVYYGTSAWPTVNVGANEVVDETGTTYPARTYNYNTTNVTNYGSGGPGNKPAPSDNGGGQQQAAYKLADGADILPNGTMTMPLTDQSYLVPTPQGTQLVDQASGQPIVSLYNDPALVYQAAVELKRQRHRLTNAIDRAQKNQGDEANIPAEKLAKMQEKANLLQTALNNLGPIPPNPPSHDQAQPLVPGGVELFASVWMTPDGKYLAIKRSNGHIAYMDGHGWYRDMGKTKLHTPYPEKLKTIAQSFLTKMVSDSNATKNMMAQDLKEGNTHLDMLNRELSDYQADPNGKPTDMVDFGSRKLQRAEAIRLTKLAVARTQNKLSELQKQIDGLPGETELAQKELASLGGPS